MSWAVLLGLVLALGIALLASLLRRAELARMEQRIRDRDRAVRAGSAKAQLRHPVVDLSRCLGCGTCVAACPEEGVLDLVHGQAVVVNGARCVGHAACERECPVGAITVTLTNLEERRDIPAITDELEAVGAPGLFLAGELTAHALIKTAIEHGTAVATEVAQRVDRTAASDPDALDLCIVGAGPAGLACSLEAKRRGLRYVTLDQATETGGSVAKYPRRKLVVTQPVALPLHGLLERTSYTKEELVELWQRIAREHELPIRFDTLVEGLERDAQGRFVVRASGGAITARNVCLALGRRGTPRRLDVPGEDLPKVAYSLLDARSYQGRRILVVGGGDAAVETALGLAEQPGNEVTLSYRQESFFRIRSRNEQRLERARAKGRLNVVLASRVVAIRPDVVELAIGAGASAQVATLANDEVFVMAGGTLPFDLLQRAGVSFDPALRAASPTVGEQGTGLVRALSIGFALALGAAAWALWNADYYMLAPEVRATHAKHALLRPGQGLGFALGIVAAALVAGNLLYLVRRYARTRWQLGSIRAWMTSHVATGILALICATLHAAMAPRDTVGGHALLALLALFVSGAIGRYFYAYVPRAANGRELELEEVKLRLDALSNEWDTAQKSFLDRVQSEIAARQWRTSFFGRLWALVGSQRDLKRLLARIEDDARAAGLSDDHIDETLHLARKSYRAVVAAAHFEDLRGVLGGWRYAHRWIAALLVALLVLHVVYVFSYGAFLPDGRIP